MRSTLVRRAIRTALVGGVVAGSLLGAVPQAGASLDPGELAVAAAGSDTTENIMGQYLAGKTSSTFGGTTYAIETYNIPAFPAAAGYSVPDDGNCGVVAGSEALFPGGVMVWKQAPATPTAPSGSGAGRARLGQEFTAGRACMDIGRSSSKGSEAGFEYYAFALDAVTWATPSLKAPAFLTRDQVKKIYDCTYDDWSDVGGVPGPIQRYLPPTSSGTRQVFNTEFLDLASNGAVTATSPTCPAAKEASGTPAKPFEENQGLTIDAADIDKAILPYSAGVWVYQKNNSVNPTLDKRNGVRLGGLQTAPASGSPVIGNVGRWNGTSGKYELDFVNATNPDAVVSDQNTALQNPGGFSKVTGFSGIRFLFNVVDSNNTLSRGPARGLVGFDNSAGGEKSPMCNNAARNTILSFGFAPLTTTGGGNNNLAGATCRKF